VHRVRPIRKTFTVPDGYLDVSHENLFTGHLPSQLVIGCVDNTSFKGNGSKSPFSFKRFPLSEITVYLDGQQHGMKPLTSNFANGLHISTVMGLFSAISKANLDEGNDIKRFVSDSGYALYAFDLTPDLSKDNHFNLARPGRPTVRVDMRFANALPNTITVLAYAEFENIIEIDSINHHVIFDFNN
jgi:hypothetical protein